MMKNIKYLLIILTFLFILPFNTYALSNDYKDVVSEITNDKIESNKINFYLFHGKECPHCKEEKEWINKIKKTYDTKVNFIYYEVWHDEDNASMMRKVQEKLDVVNEGVPLTVIGDQAYVGFSDTIKNKIENKILYYIDAKNDKNFVKLPFLNEVNMKSVSIPLVAIVLGLVDGFNPCAMWILLFLINMLFGMKNKKRMWALGITFLLASAFVYFLSMLGISYVLSISAITWIRRIIAIVALVFGIISIKDYIKTKNDDGCNVVDEKKRKKIFTKINKFTHEKSFLLALLGVIVLGFSVNLIELACSLGFPMIFTEILAINNVNGLLRIIYLLIYILFYMLDDIIIFVIAMISLEVTGITTKYNKIAHLIGGILMILMAILLIFKPEWLMFNF